MNVLDFAALEVDSSWVVCPNQVVGQNLVVCPSHIARVTHIRGNSLYHMIALSEGVFYPGK